MSQVFFEKEAKNIAQMLRESSRPLVLLLEGPLGAGKTTFTKELLSTLGFSENEVQSPTFLKLFEYRIPKLGLCLHIDAYRMEDEDDVEKLSLESYDQLQLVVIEWPRLVLEYLKARPWILKMWNSPKFLNVKITSQHQLTMSDLEI